MKHDAKDLYVFWDKYWSILREMWQSVTLFFRVLSYCMQRAAGVQLLPFSVLLVWHPHLHPITYLLFAHSRRSTRLAAHTESNKTKIKQ